MDTRISSRTSVVVAVIAAVLAVLGAPAAAPGDIIEYPVPTRVPSGLPGGPDAIAAGPDGNLWFTQVTDPLHDVNAGTIGRITPTGTITEYPLPTAYSVLGAIAAGADGNVWFTETIYNPDRSRRILGCAIGRITPEGVITEFPQSAGGANFIHCAGGIAAGPDGNMWFFQATETICEPNPCYPSSHSAIARITPTGTITEFPLTKGGFGGIAAGPDGNMWLTASDEIVRITPTGTITEFPITTAAWPIGGIAAGPDGNMWFTEYTDRIGRITPTGVITEFPVPAKYSRNGEPGGIAAGPDGNVWFTQETSAIGRITPEGVITQYKLPTYGSQPRGIAAGPDGNMWFTTRKTIGRISPTATPILKWTCPLTVTLHKPAPKAVGKRNLTDRIKTNNFCVLPKPVVRCRPLASTTAGKKASCGTKITKRGSIRVNTKRYEAVRVTVIARATPEKDKSHYFPGPWKRNTWRKSWILR